MRNNFPFSKLSATVGQVGSELDIEMLVRLVLGCQAAGLRLALENLPRSNLGNTTEELLRLMKSIDSPAVGVCFDFAHAFVTEGVTETIERLGQNIITVHVCDNTLPNREKICWPMETGKGLVDWPLAVCALKSAGYEGPEITVESGSVVKVPKQPISDWRPSPD